MAAMRRSRLISPSVHTSPARTPSPSHTTQHTPPSPPPTTTGNGTASVANGNAHAHAPPSAPPRTPTLRSRPYSLYEHQTSTDPQRDSEADEKDLLDAEAAADDDGDDDELDEIDEKYLPLGTSRRDWGRASRKRRKRSWLAALLPLRIPFPPFSLPSVSTTAPPSYSRPRRRQWYMVPIYLPLPTSVSSLVKCLLPLIAIALILVSLLDVQLSLEIYRKSWVAAEVKHVEPLSGCFDAARISPLYNLTLARGPKHFELHAGQPLRFGTDCYDFAGTIPAQPRHFIERTTYHMYWRADLLPFAERQVWALKSFFATQDIPKSVLILWSNGDLSHNPEILRFLQRYPENFQVRMVDIEELARGTALDGSAMLGLALNDHKAWVDGDLVRLLVVWYYGGVWVDLDSLLTRDLAPLLENEFVIQWDCYDKKYMPFNGAVLHFQQHSPYLCEAFHIMATGAPPEPNSIDWGSRLYHKLWRRVLAAGQEPFKILPWCFVDGVNCGYDNSLPDPLARDARQWGEGRDFAEGGDLDRVLSSQVFSVHIHNRWDQSFPKNGWVDRLLLRRYQQRLGWAA